MRPIRRGGAVSERRRRPSDPGAPSPVEVARRKAWFEAYVDRLDEAARRRADATASRPGQPQPCPCCRLPTLDERGAYDICPVCWWEDDGQDDPHADEVWGGPNGALSLSDARAEFDGFAAQARGPAGAALREWLDAVRLGDTPYRRADSLRLLRAAEDYGKR